MLRGQYVDVPGVLSTLPGIGATGRMHQFGYFEHLRNGTKDTEAMNVQPILAETPTQRQYLSCNQTDLTSSVYAYIERSKANKSSVRKSRRLL